ncbi:MAG: NAD(P)/FAD-dependent oxidoreductase [Desulfobacterales bacterium]|nr:NAD(P)/FAD-dependent oxidoreductase [Desulfobacterales bacterium]
MKEYVDTVIVGGGQAGVATSFFLQQNQIDHIILEKESAFSKWNKRWNSFHMNTANWMNSLPGETDNFAKEAPRNGLGSKADAIRYFESYLASVNPPIYENTEVTLIKQTQKSTWKVHTSDSTYEAKNVVICTNPLQNPKVPPVSTELPSLIPQIHSSEYRSPEQIEQGNVLIVGSGNSGVQICEDLAKSGRFNKLTFSVSGNLTFPLEILGISIYTFIRWFRIIDLKPNSWLGRKLFKSNKGDPTIPPSPKQLAEIYGIDLVGRVIGIDRTGIQCSDARTVPFEGLSIVWCTGFQSNYDFIEPLNRNKVFNTAGQPVHERGVIAASPNLYFVGLRFQYTVGSHSIYGVGKDAQYVAHCINERNAIN